MTDKLSTQEMILEAAISCIEKYGVENTTTRKIAAEAGTNIASINYYFRSKDDLLAKALEITIQHSREDLTAFATDDDLSFEECLRNSIVYLLEGSQNFPNVIMAHLYAPLVEKNFDTLPVAVFREVVDLYTQKAAQAYPGKDPARVEFLVVQIFSALFFKVLAPEFFLLESHPSHEELAEMFTAMFTRQMRAE